MIPYFKTINGETGFCVFDISGSMVVYQTYNPFSGQLFSSKEEILQYISSSIMTDPRFNPILDQSEI